MDAPDLSSLAREATNIIERIDALRDELSSAMDAALGEVNPETDEEIVPGNGDEFTFYENAKSKAGDARLALGGVVDTLATQQGYRDFDASGVSS